MAAVLSIMPKLILEEKKIILAVLRVFSLLSLKVFTNLSVTKRSGEDITLSGC